MLKRLLPIILFILLMSLALGGIAYFLSQEALTEKVQPQQQTVIIKAGSSVSKIAQQLEDAGIIRSALLMRILLKLEKQHISLKQGHYRFTQAATMRDVIQRLQEEDVERLFVTIPEGLRSDEILQILAKRTPASLKTWQHAWKSLPNHAEGVLLPETYDYQEPVHPHQFLQRMMKAQAKVLAKIASPDPQRMRIIASIIEKETAIAEERALVSAVIHNRLRLGMPMQMDPTVIYGLYQVDGNFSGNLRRIDLKRDTPWNTYVHKGLPPTPICHPGAASLRAAAQPAKVDYLYFVADGSGGHAFASTHKQHLKNVRQWIRIQRSQP